MLGPVEPHVPDDNLIKYLCETVRALFDIVIWF